MLDYAHMWTCTLCKNVSLENVIHKTYCLGNLSVLSKRDNAGGIIFYYYHQK